MKKKIFLFLFILLIINLYKLSMNDVVIPDASIRLRVIPNSNSSNDIYIKEEVKEYLENDLYYLTKDISNIDDARIIINNDIDNIKDNIDNIFIKNNYLLDYSVDYGLNYFPEKVYKGVTYEEGYYESLVISIGEGNGDNFWCVLFPNFCLIDMDDDIEYKSYFKELLNKIF